MIEVEKNENGDIVAVCEWLLFNDDALMDDKGKIVCVCELEINKAYRGNGIIRKFMRSIANKVPDANRVFYMRENKYPGRPFKVFTREQILKRMGG